MTLRYAELEQYAKDTRAKVDKTQGEVDILHRGVTELDRRAKSAATKVDKVEKAASETKKQVAKAQLDIGKAARDATRFTSDIGQRLGRLGRLLGSEGFAKFTEGFDLGDNSRDAIRALGVAGDSAAGASKLGGIVPVVGAAVGAVVGGALGSIREQERVQGRRNRIEVRNQEFEFQQRTAAARRLEESRIATTASAEAGARNARRVLAEADRQSQVGQGFLASAQERDAALRRARGAR